MFYKERSKLKKLDKDVFNNKFEIDSRKRCCFYSEYFENKPVLLDGDIGKEIINMFSNGYSCYLPLIRRIIELFEGLYCYLNYLSYFIA